MKKLILSVTAIAGLSMAANAQQVLFHDSNSSNPQSNDVTIDGVVNTTQDLNLELLVGATSSSVSTDVVTLLLSQATSTATTALGSVQSGKGDINAVGLIVDQSGNSYTVPAGTDYYQILAWTGNFSSYSAAVAAGAGVAFGETPVYQFDASATPASGAPAATEDLPVDLNLVTSAVPEPSTLAMAGVGLASMLIFRRKSK
jgi:hypothetical protein